MAHKNVSFIIATKNLRIMLAVNPGLKRLLFLKKKTLTNILISNTTNSCIGIDSILAIMHFVTLKELFYSFIWF